MDSHHNCRRRAQHNTALSVPVLSSAQTPIHCVYVHNRSRAQDQSADAWRTGMSSCSVRTITSGPILSSVQDNNAWAISLLIESSKDIPYPVYSILNAKIAMLYSHVLLLIVVNYRPCSVLTVKSGCARNVSLKVRSPHNAWALSRVRSFSRVSVAVQRKVCSTTAKGESFATLDS